ncbi:MAG TPA: hypothetical protein VGL61_29625 [Kofleriaceae bacterium]|jgi:hypothetical protein
MRWVLVLAVVAGCTESPTLDTQTIAAIVCDCITPTGTTACIDELEPEIASGSAACSTCVEQYEASCTDLLAQCELPCIQQEGEPIDRHFAREQVETHGNP